MKKTLLTIALTGMLAFAAQAEVLKGTFAGIDQGDYVHLNVKNEKGELQSFWLTQDKSFTPFVENPKKFQGKKVEVTWHKVTRDIPEAGGKMEIEEATSIKLLP